VRTGGNAREPMSRRASQVRAVSSVCVLLAGLSGCGHKQIRAHIPPATPVALESMNEPDTQQLDTLPEPDMVPLPWPEPPRPPVRRRPPARDDVTNPPPAEQPAAPELSIGALSTGGDAKPQSLQQARDLIASVDRRITSLPSRSADAGRPQVRRVRNFLDQAKKALDTGDTDGAMNLANKAKVLMDELEQR
jgi:hypothetical protein